jgi:hypothetical protein
MVKRVLLRSTLGHASVIVPGVGEYRTLFRPHIPEQLPIPPLVRYSQTYCLMVYRLAYTVSPSAHVPTGGDLIRKEDYWKWQFRSALAEFLNGAEADDWMWCY